MRKLYKTSDTQNIMYKEFEQNDCTEKRLHAKQAQLADSCTLHAVSFTERAK